MENGTGHESESQAREDSRKLFIGGLSWDTYENDLKDYFSKYGTVENVNLKKDAYTQKSRGFAFVLFKDTETLDKILDGTPHTIKGKKVDPKRAKSRPGKIFVGGLNSEMSDDDIKNHFSQFGKITETEMPFDKQKNQRKGFCFITFEHEDVMKEAIKNSTQTICGKQVDVKKATPRTDQGFGMMPGGRGAMMRGAMRGDMRGRGGRGRGFQASPYDQYNGYSGYNSGYGDYSGYAGYDPYSGYGGYGAAAGYGGAYGYH